MNITSFDMNVRRYFVVFRSTRVYMKIYAGQPGSREGCPGLARCGRVDPVVV